MAHKHHENIKQETQQFQEYEPDVYLREGDKLKQCSDANEFNFYLLFSRNEVIHLQTNRNKKTFISNSINQ